MKPKLSIVVAIGKLPRFNFEKFLPIALELLDAQTLAKKHWELVISDYQSKSRSYVKKALKLFPRLHVTYVYTPPTKDNEWCGAKCKNIGVSRTRNDIIILMHPDSWLHPRALENIYHILIRKKRKEQKLYLGIKYNLDEKRTRDMIDHKLKPSILFSREYRQYLERYGKGAKGDFQVLSKKAFMFLKGYDEDFKGRGGDDYDFCDRFELHFNSKPVWLDRPFFFMIHPYHERDSSRSHINLALLREKRRQRGE